MADRISPERRSANMARIKGKDTGPELAVRRMLHAAGYRFRLHRRDLPGTPDIVFPLRRKAVFVHGCFFHGHAGCRLAVTPSTRREFWSAKIGRNRDRDRLNVAALEDSGWAVAIVWECELGASDLRTRVFTFLGPPGSSRIHG